MGKIANMVSDAIAEALDVDGKIDSKLIGVEVASCLTPGEVFDEAVLHLADRSRHIVNHKPGAGGIGIKDNTPTTDPIESLQMDLFGCNVQKLYSVNDEYVRLDMMTDFEIIAQAAALQSKGESCISHGQELRAYVNKRGGVIKTL